MFNIDDLTEEQFDALIDHALNLFPVLAEDCLATTDEDQYNRLMKFYNDDDYELAIELTNDLDGFDYEENGFENVDDVLCAQFYLNAKPDTLKNDVHLADIIFSAKVEEENTISAIWFPED